MSHIGRLSHIGFSVPRDLWEQENHFWQNVMGLTFTHGDPGRVAFYTSDPFRDHEFILYCVDGPVAGWGDPACLVNHLAFDVPTDADVDEFSARIRAVGVDVDDQGFRGRRQNKVTSPAGIHFEINTPPYTFTQPRDDAPGQKAQEPATAGVR